ncbi:unnamed protein product [Urochloa decumbens]|uniref:Protein FAR1-RELATED SEQUENCE n=1 Tax=Urochloa decumbens TaxID=240449 RepID=A0ABC9DZX7_9POAL
MDNHEFGKVGDEAGCMDVLAGVGTDRAVIETIMVEEEGESSNPVGEVAEHLLAVNLNDVPAASVCASSNQCYELAAVEGGECDDVEVSSNGTGVVPWKTRNRAISGPDFREKLEGKMGALEHALLKFADRKNPYIISPDVGTEFDHVEEAYEYYNLYSWECGFGIKWGKERIADNKESRKLPLEQRYKLGREINCSCSGRPGVGLKTSSCRTQCTARIRLARTSDHGRIVAEHVAEHNHALSETYGENKQWPSHHHLDRYTKDLIRMLRENNIGITKLYSILGSFFGKMANVPATKRSLKYLCQKINREHAEGDIKKTLDQFSAMMKDDPGFKYIIDPDDDGRIRTLMWTNSRSRMQYEHFGDAITFDTTYKTNMYEMPFELFVGVNNHFQSVLLGGVLMTDETIESFKWVFREFAKLMGGKEPMTILIDQCRAMEVAIAEEWKNTVHRWCKWHVLKRIAECLGVKYTGDKDFQNKFHRLVNEMMTIDEFEAAWGQLMKDYALEDNAFMKQVFAVREMWVKSYFKDVFCARMTSTQRSESANMMLKNIVPPNSTLHKFVEQYDKLQYIRDEEENYQEKRSKLESRKRNVGGPLVVHAYKLYTPNVHSMFCEIKDKSENYRCIPVVPGVEYIAEHYNLDFVQKWYKGRYKVSVTEDGSMYECECGLH